MSESLVELLTFIDDLVLIKKSQDGISKLFSRLNVVAKKVGL